MRNHKITGDFLPSEAKRQLWQKLRPDRNVIARKEKALAQLAAQLDEVAAAIPPAAAKAETAEAKAKASAADAATAKRELQELRPRTRPAGTPSGGGHARAYAQARRVALNASSSWPKTPARLSCERTIGASQSDTFRLTD